MAAPIPIPPNIQVIAGPSLLGYVFNWALYGALSVQVYIYYMSFPKDRAGIKALVYGIYILETIQTILITHDLFRVYAIGWGNLELLGDIGLTWLGVPIFSGIVSCMVQIFFAYRISILSGSNIIAGVICVVALTQCTAAIVAGVQAKIIGNFVELQTKAFVSTAIWLTGSAVCDVIIAGCMSYFLSKKDIAFKSTQVMIDKLVRLSIETGSLTATIATVDIILFLAFPHNNYHTAPALTLAKLYTNTLLLIFNSRVRVVGGRGETYSSSDHMEIQSNKLNPSTLVNRNAAPIRVNPGQSVSDSINVGKSTWTDSTAAKFDGGKSQYLTDGPDRVDGPIMLNDLGRRDDHRQRV